MHFSKTILLFAGTSVAIPLVGLGVASSGTEIEAAGAKLALRAVTTTAKPTTTTKPPTTTAKTTSTAKPTTTAPSSSGLTSAQGATIISDLNNFDAVVLKAITALNSFTGGSNIGSQATAVANAGNAWQTATVKVLTDVKALANKGKFVAADSTKIAGLLSGAITTDLVKIFQVLKDKKSLFAQINTTKNVYDGLLVLVSEFQDIAEYLIPMLLSQDLSALQTASSKVNPAAIAAINAYAS